MVIMTATADGAAIGDDDFAFTVGDGGNVANTTVVSATQMTITLTEAGKTRFMVQLVLLLTM